MPFLPLLHTTFVGDDRPQTAPQIGGGLSYGGAGGKMAVSIIDLPLADPAEPLLRWIIKGTLNFTGSGAGAANAAIAATSPSSLRLRKNGAANGTIAFTGTSGVISFSNSSYADGDVFEIYPPTSIDATLDRVSITFQTD